MEPNVFLGCLERGITMWPNEEGITMSPNEGIAVSPNEGIAVSPYEAIAVSPNEGIAFFLDFGRAMQYSSNCQKIWYGTQNISRILRKGYYTFIEDFVLWT